MKSTEGQQDSEPESRVQDTGKPNVHVQTRPDIEELLRDTPRLEAAIRRAVIQAIQMHKRAGNPIAVWREGKVVWLSPEEIPDAPDESP